MCGNRNTPTGSPPRIFDGVWTCDTSVLWPVPSALINASLMVQ